MERMMECNSCNGGDYPYLSDKYGECLLCQGTGFILPCQSDLVDMVKGLMWIEKHCPKIPEESEQELRKRLGDWYVEF